MGSPPPDGSKNDVLKLRSVSNIVIAPANTGSDNSNKIAVSKTDHTNSGVFSIVMLFDRIFMIVVIKLADPMIDDAPARCNEKIAKSTDDPAWVILAAKGGYTVHPVPAPVSTAADVVSIINAGGNNQNLMLFIRGNAMSGAPIISGTRKLPNPPIIIGITIKKIIINAWAVTITL